MVGKKLRTYFFAGFIIVILTLVLTIHSFVLAQEDDGDADGIIDSIDACPLTNALEGLPINVRDREYLGCSCSQIYEKTGTNYCLDVFCSTDRPLLINERAYSSRVTNCSSDYCVRSTLYDYPENTQTACIDGKEKSFDCTPKIVENASVCINGTILQYELKNSAGINNGFTPDTNTVLLDDYEKLQLRAYSISQDITIRTTLGISGEELFLKESKKTMDLIKIDKSMTTETKTLINTEKTITTKTITITPNKHITLKKIYVFEELPREAKVELKDIIPGAGVVYRADGPVILVFEIDKISKPTEITYQVVKPLQGESNTLVIAKEIKNNTWMLGFIPLGIIIIFICIFIYVSKKSVPRRTRIFKE
jgi:hypothetical protein